MGEPWEKQRLRKPCACGAPKSPGSKACLACSTAKLSDRSREFEESLLLSLDGSTLICRHGEKQAWLQCECGREHLRPISWVKKTNIGLARHVCRKCAQDAKRCKIAKCLPADRSQNGIKTKAGQRLENAQRGGRSVLSEEEGREARQPGPPRVASSQLAHEERRYGSVV